VATPVDMPKSGNTVEECEIGRWLKHTGDVVSAGDIVVEIETDKATFEIAAPVGGTMLATFFEEGAVVPVFTTVCVIGAPGEAVERYKPEGIRDRSQIPSAKLSASLSPRARRFASEHAFQATGITGSGPGGRVLERDVRREYELAQPLRTAETPAVPGTSAKRQSHEQQVAPGAGAATALVFTLDSWADASGLLALRRQVTALEPHVPDVTIDHLVCFCVVRALADAPELNATILQGRIVRHQAIHLGFACRAPSGLLVPVVRDVNTLSLVKLSALMQERVKQTVAGQIAADDLSGGTFTITGADAFGGLGIDTFRPAIPAPQVATLGVGAMHLRPLRKGTALNDVAFVDAIPLSLACDQRAVGAASAATFLGRVREKIERIEYDLILRGS
jgi:pyruvate dehydrogenase E2 component (dihydrolipoyllysine-residue acetyltransferase)